jgi:folate-binding protein YgfZ
MTLDYPLPSARLRQIRRGALAVSERPAILSVEGPGALTCLQGLVTSDLVAAGEPSLCYGALLTPRGMIVSDLWVLRDAGAFVLAFPREARETVLALFAKTLPPRLAKVTDLSESLTAVKLFGGGTEALSARLADLGPPLRLGGAPLSAPFRFLILGPTEALGELVRELGPAGVTEGTEADFAASMILAGWPALGREIDEKSLPQEVRFDENAGVSYTKGCYTGQETVARIHFRGHVNRTLRGIVRPGVQELGDRVLRSPEREVGSVRSALRLDDRVVGLAMIRREVEAGAELEVAGSAATVVPLPVTDAALGL